MKKPFRRKPWKPRYDPGYAEWREKVLQRDHYMCQMPSCHRQAREVHHIRRYADNVYLRTQVGNGISLCRSCHYMVKNKEKEYAPIFLSILCSK